MREVKGGKIIVKGIQHKRVQTSAGYSQNNPELAIKITKILYSVLLNIIYYTIVLQPILEISKPTEIHIVLLLILLLCDEFGKSGISIYII